VREEDFDMPVIEIKFIEGVVATTPEQKRQLIERLTEDFIEKRSTCWGVSAARGNQPSRGWSSIVSAFNCQN
jgi:hypothetical protein